MHATDKPHHSDKTAITKCCSHLSALEKGCEASQFLGDFSILLPPYGVRLFTDENSGRTASGGVRLDWLLHQVLDAQQATEY